MKTLQKITLAIAFITLVASCQSGVDVKQVLSKSDTRKAIMDTIANNTEMAKEMMATLMNSKNCKMAMMENHETMMKMMKHNPDMMKSMMRDMMESCKNDTAMMHSMCKTMMGNNEMKHMMMGKDKIKGIDPKHHQ